MNCDEFREVLADLLYEDLPSAGLEDARRHELSCTACRNERASLEATKQGLNAWAALREWTPFGFDDGDAHVDTTPIRSTHRGPIRPWRLWMTPSTIGVAAALATFAVLSHFSAEIQDCPYSDFALQPPPEGVAIENAGGESAQADYVLFLYKRTGFPERQGETSERARVEEYRTWAEAWHERGRLKMGEKLDSLGGRRIGGTAEPDPGSTDRLTLAGFFLIRADSDDEAAEIAETCPHLKYGGEIEVRRIARLGKGP